MVDPKLLNYSKDRFNIAQDRPDVNIDRNFAGHTMFQDSVIRFKRNKGAVVGLICIIIIIFLALAGPAMTDYDYLKVDMSISNLPLKVPGIEKLGFWNGTRNGMDVYEQKGVPEGTYYIFGTDSLGRDLWSRVWMGTRISLFVALVAVLADMIIGITIGVVSGYFGGWVDIVLQRITEIIWGIPNLVVVTLLMLILKPGLTSIILALLFSGWIGMSRLVRAQVLKLKEMEYVLVGKTLGASPWNLIFKDILPNTMAQIIIMAMMSVPGAIFTEAFLSYIGLGIPAPQASLGVLINDGYQNMLLFPYQVLLPVIVFAVLMISLNLFADGLRDAMDPKMKQK